MADNAPVGGKGLFESLTGFAATLVALAQTRLELLSTDLEEERLHVLSLLVSVLAALFLVGVGLVLATVLLLVAFWDEHRLLALGSLAGFFLAAGLTVTAAAVRKARRKPRLFAASLSELNKDRQQLVPRA